MAIGSAISCLICAPLASLNTSVRGTVVSLSKGVLRSMSMTWYPPGFSSTGDPGVRVIRPTSRIDMDGAAPEPPPAPVVPVIPVVEAPPEKPKRGWWRR